MKNVLCLVTLFSFSILSAHFETLTFNKQFQMINDSLPELKMAGVKIFVNDLSKAKKFYSDFLGFKILKKEESQIVLETSMYPIYIKKSMGKINRNVQALSHIGTSIQVYKLLPAIDLFRKSGYKVYDSLVSRNGVGIDVPIEDPAGNLLHLMEVQIAEIPPFEGFLLYNSGIVVPDMDKAEDFYLQKLGFKAWSRNYLPDALPLKHVDGSFAFMLHQNPDVKHSTSDYGTCPQMNLILSTPDLENTEKHLVNMMFDLFRKKDHLVLRDEHGNYIEIIQK